MHQRPKRGENIVFLKKAHEEKAALVSEIVELMKSSKSMVVIDYRGLTVEEDTALRTQFRKAGVTYKVLKNKLVTRAAAELGLSEMDAHLNGPSSFAFGMSDPVAPAKIVSEYIAKNKKMVIKCGVLDGRVIDAAGVKALADLPPREVLIAKMLGSMNAPITGFVNVLAGTLRSLLYTLNAIKDQKEA